MRQGVFPGGETIEYRREMRRRLAIGLAGLMVMLLLVMLAGLLSGQARREAETAKAQAEAAGVVNPGSAKPSLPAPTEPLGDILVDTPAPPPAASARRPVVPNASGAVVVPDLEPDPRLDPAQKAP